MNGHGDIQLNFYFFFFPRFRRLSRADALHPAKTDTARWVVLFARAYGLRARVPTRQQQDTADTLARAVRPGAGRRVGHGSRALSRLGLARRQRALLRANKELSPRSVYAPPRPTPLGLTGHG
ncbi:Methylenetetrahydrofolate--tRNA-(uracil-5-)-methyltransferase [Frankliniella fusca]|uniref:Methylenetetrahydrofolate--tRNA-(Uracil-5-)-methyltransferase n=1 Tax=Frankliniella fusca TaxID=407009 RepID=A0AAE1LE23_9NEOP|nr:Methylenetetrahydrofolate--tRNA-(uracil-5-)-methyltransferase [Frankliniella fusca]